MVPPAARLAPVTLRILPPPTPPAKTKGRSGKAEALNPRTARDDFLRRAGIGLLTLWAAVTLAFFALRLAAGDPTDNLLAQGLASPEQAQALRESRGLAQPLMIQYVGSLMGLARGDLGRSLFTQRLVTRTIADQAGATVQLAAAGLFVAACLGTLLGFAAGWAGRSLLGRASGGISGLAENLQAPFLLAARARGVGHGTRLAWHALRPALPLAISFLALEASLLLGGTVVTEVVFARPGLGRLLVTSILTGAFPVVQGLGLLAATIYTLTHIAADTVSARVDPRLRSNP